MCVIFNEQCTVGLFLTIIFTLVMSVAGQWNFGPDESYPERHDSGFTEDAAVTGFAAIKEWVSNNSEYFALCSAAFFCLRGKVTHVDKSYK